jgi:VIT1/CCC1 family predicted Fe2+/Mn2+ transporter
MRKAKRRGLNFGLTSGVITTLGLMFGLSSSTHSRIAILGGIITIAIADAMSDAMGIHMSEEATSNDHKLVWQATKYTFLSKFFLALSFVIPIVLLSTFWALATSVLWGTAIISFVSIKIAKRERKKPLPILAEHLGITTLVIVLTHFLGILIGKVF